MVYQGVLQDIFCIPRILGTFPFDNQFKLSKKLLAYCCLVRLLSTIGALSTLAFSSSTYSKVERVLFFGISLRFCLLITIVAYNIFTLFWWILKQHRLSFLMDSINEIQRTQNSTVGRKKVRLVHYHLIFALINFTLRCYTNSSGDETVRILFWEICSFFSYCSTISFVGQFWDILHLLGQLFRESTQLCDESSVVYYERFSDLMEHVSEIYGSHILFTITKYFLEIIIHLYSLLLPLHSGIDAINVRSVGLVMCCVLSIGSIVQACDYYMKQEQSFNEDLRTRIIEDKSRVLLKKEKLYFHFLARRETAFTACGLFVVDRSLICSMLSVYLTYLVLVLQYGSDLITSSTTQSPANI